MDAQGVGLDLAGGGGSYAIVGAAMHVDTHLEYGAMIAMRRSLPSERCFGRSGRRRRGLVKLEGRLSSKQIFSERYLPRLESRDGLEVRRQMILHEMPLEELSVQLGSGGEDDGKEENAYEKSLAVGFSEILRVWTERDRGRAHRGWLRSDRHLRRTRPVLLDST